MTTREKMAMKSKYGKEGKERFHDPLAIAIRKYCKTLEKL